jgi:hypothetical protein
LALVSTHCVNPTASSNLHSGVGGAVSGSVGAGFNVSAFTNVTSGFTTAIDAKLGACSLSAADKASLRASAFGAFFGDASTTFSAHCGFGASVMAAVDASIAGKTAVLGSIKAGLGAVSDFGASLDGKIGACNLSADLKAQLAANAIAAVYAAGNADAQIGACGSVLGKVDSAISAGVAVIGSIGGSAGGSVGGSVGGAIGGSAGKLPSLHC